MWVDSIVLSVEIVDLIFFKTLFIVEFDFKSEWQGDGIKRVLSALVDELGVK